MKTNSAKLIESSVLSLVLVGLMLALGCSPVTGGDSGGQASVDPTPTPTPVATPDPATLSPLKFAVATAWDDAPTDFQTHKVCEVPPATPRGGPVPDCTLSIAEARLFYSSTRFTISTDRPDVCRALTFIPYYYPRSLDPNYVPPGETSAPGCDKPLLERDPKCWGGAGVYIIPDFPRNGGLTMLTYASNSFSETVESEFKLRHYGGARVNYLITNDLTDRNTVITPVDEPKTYLGGDLMQDYEVRCEDQWGFLWYTMKIIISDEDYEGADNHVEDEYENWQ